MRTRDEFMMAVYGGEYEMARDIYESGECEYENILMAMAVCCQSKNQESFDFLFPLLECGKANYERALNINVIFQNLLNWGDEDNLKLFMQKYKPNKNSGCLLVKDLDRDNYVKLFEIISPFLETEKIQEAYKHIASFDDPKLMDEISKTKSFTERITNDNTEGDGKVKQYTFYQALLNVMDEKAYKSIKYLLPEVMDGDYQFYAARVIVRGGDKLLIDWAFDLMDERDREDIDIYCKEEMMVDGKYRSGARYFLNLCESLKTKKEMEGQIKGKVHKTPKTKIYKI